MPSGQAPLSAVLTALVQPVSTAGNTLNTAAFRAPFDGFVTAVAYAPVSAITGAATNNRAVALVNKGHAGAGSTSIAAITYASGVNAAAFDENVVTLSSTPANLVVAEGDILAWVSSPNGTGATDPGGLVELTIERD